MNEGNDDRGQRRMNIQYNSKLWRENDVLVRIVKLIYVGKNVKSNC